MRPSALLFASLALTLSCTALPEIKKPSAPALLVANQTDHTLLLIDPATTHTIATIPEDRVTGHEVATSPDGRTAFLPIYGDSGVGRAGTDGHEILVIDLASRKITSTIAFDHGVRPHCAVYDRTGNLLYVTTELDQTITVIDPHTFKILHTVPTGQAESHMLALSHDGRLGYTANVGPGTISFLDMHARTTLAILPIAAKIQRISISNDDKLLFTADYTRPQLAIVDTATRKLKTFVPLPALAYGTASTHDGRYLLICLPTAHQVAVLDLATLKITHTIDVPAAPQEVLVRPDGQVAYVSCNLSGKVAAIDLTNFTLQSLIDAGHGADGLAWAQ